VAAPHTTPLRFRPIYQERVWGGRRLAELYDRELPAGAPIGESWELVDRPDAQSLVAAGEFAGRTLGELWTDHRGLFGSRAAHLSGRFPLLIKLLDAREMLSVQVHPPPALAPSLAGEPKTETWFVADAAPGAHLLVGLGAGVTRAAFERALDAGGDVAAMLNRLDVSPGDSILIPSGRVHAIGPGNVILEIQQNSDTTYRVFDFNRPGLDGRPRELHRNQSLASIDFDDIEPTLAPPGDGGAAVSSAFFELVHTTIDGAQEIAPAGEMVVVCVLAGHAICAGTTLHPGDLALVPAGPAPPTLAPADGHPVDVVRAMLPPVAAVA
jgi:mannose-6-phosphate isomerase